MRSLLGACLAIASLATMSCDRRPAGDSRLCEALQTGDTNYLQGYLTAGGDVNRPVQYVRSRRVKAPLLDVAVDYGQVVTVDFLLKKGASPTLCDGDGHTTVRWAVACSVNGVAHETRVQILNMLLKAGADPNAKDSSRYGWTALMSAAVIGDPEFIAILLAAGADVKATSNIGQTALHLADSAEVATLLISAGGDRNARTIYGETPADYATANRRFGLLTVLTNAPPEINRNAKSIK